ncbi:MAG: efflux RND transporter periplasmic adaptor subunit [Nitrospirales bacterium]|nr:efflux RND transporter periplasmic adaptor subunit [Nitrospirales bacterium]
MRKVLIRTILLAVLGVAVFSASAFFLYLRSSVIAEDYQLVSPVRATIVQKVTANGMIIPRQEVKIKPQISGVIEHILVKRGDRVQKHDLLATIEPYPNPMDISVAETQLRDARVRYNHATRQYLRYKKLYEKETVTRHDYDQVHLDFKLAEQNLSSAKRNVEIVKTGASRELGRSASEVRATIGGMVLERPIEIGTFVIESNTFNEGTTIVTLADMTDLIFKGQVDEPDAGKLAIDMPVGITVGAFPEKVLNGIIEFIAPKAVTSKEGRITFEIRAGLKLDPNLFVRAGYSATADIVVDRREQVLAIPEQYLNFIEDQPTLFVEIAPQKFEARPIEVGISDGLKVEITKGLTEHDRIRVDGIPSS